MSARKVLEHVGYDARRVAQTRRAFNNWPMLLEQLIGEKVGRGADTLTFVTRSGLRMTCPNVPGARLPMYEQFADDCYDAAWVLGDGDGPLHVLDVGAHVGAFAVNLATARPGVQVECYEPSPESAAFLRRNLAQNGLAERVRVSECAMAGEVGTALLDDNEGGSVHNGLVRADSRLVAGRDGLGARTTVAVRTTTFAQALRDAPAAFDVVKMDCEGGEYELVYASDPADWASVQRVVMEYHPVDGESWAALKAWFADAGLHVVAAKSDRPGLGTAWLARAGTPAPAKEAVHPHTAARALHDRRYRAQRFSQTPRTFANWGEILRDMALERVGRGPQELTFRTRSGLRINTPNRPGARVPVYEIFADDSYRFEWFLGPLLDRPIQVVDIGGHVGTFSCRLTQLHPQARVQAFEPSATTAAYLRRNAAQNRVADRVEVFQRALAGNTGVAMFDDNGAGSGLNGLVAAGHSTGTALEVETIAFDDAVADAPAPVDVVKIDCEGGEYDLVLGSKPESWASVQRVVIEHHPVPGHSWDELRDYFAAVGLAVQDVEEGGVHGCVWLSRDPLPPLPA